MQESFTREFDSLDEIFAFINRFLATEGLDEKVTFPIDLAVEELFTNMVKYNTGGGNEISISIGKRDDAVVLELIDFDVDPFDPSKAPQANVDDAIEDRRIGGLGLRLVRSVVDKITYEYKNRQMKVSVFKKLER
ncbi:MAG: ATP-binding protein [Candidatus Krumholzibacteria bacterium]|nr:ATP-binding protein [Candidatus Krumholzibacteria bacterium]